MSQPTSDADPTAALSPPTDSNQAPINHERAAEIERQGTRNLFVLAMYQVVVRIGWIFKTETVIMPAFLDAIAGAGWLRGCLPILNRLGQSVPPLLFAERLQHMHRKKSALVSTALLMAVPFLVLSPLWLGLGYFSVSRENTWWLPTAFLLLYAMFFSMTGLNQLCFSTLQGKLVQANRRGRLMTMAGLVGSGSAIVCAWFLLPSWLKREGGGFEWIFGMTAFGFLSSAVIAILLKEPADDVPIRQVSPVLSHFQRAWETYVEDHNFRRLIWVSMMFMSAMMLFPHYQALGREQLGSEQKDLLAFLIAQNVGTGGFSLISGTIADRFGNRLCLRVCMLFAAFAPILALGLAYGWIPGGRDWYWSAFLLLGLTPLTIRCLVNYALELVDETGHTRYVSTLTLMMAVPFLFSPLVGWLVDVWGFSSVFLGASVLIFAGGLMTYMLIEPRHGLDTSAR